MSESTSMADMAARAAEAADALVKLNSRKKNTVLNAMADALDASREAIMAANRQDVEDAVNDGESETMVDRLRLTESRFGNMTRRMRAVAALKDPIGTKISRWIRPNGLEIVKRRVPIGVIAVIYESCPHVTADAAALCLKTSNAVILRGGREALRSNQAIAAALAEAGKAKGLPDDAVQLVETKDRQAITELIQLEGVVDLVIPRGGEALLRIVTELATVPVIKHDKGVCHIYVDASADLDMAHAVVENAKCQRPAICNALETLLVHEDVARTFLPELTRRLVKNGVELRGDSAAREICSEMETASEEDWSTEYLDRILAVKVVPSLTAAIEHINRYGSHHSDGIIAELEGVQNRFAQAVDSAAVFINASTRFMDGAEFGMGTDIGVSTDKLHARGPVGMEELTTYKYVVQGRGQLRD